MYNLGRLGMWAVALVTLLALIAVFSQVPAPPSSEGGTMEQARRAGFQQTEYGARLAGLWTGVGVLLAIAPLVLRKEGGASAVPAAMPLAENVEARGPAAPRPPYQ